MPDQLPAEHREPPERVNRTTRSGEDLYVLACNARRTASPKMLLLIEQLERENNELRRELEWKQKHGSRFTAQWFGGRLVLSLYVIAIAIWFGFWLFTPNGRTFRIALGAASKAMTGGARLERSFITSDMTQLEIDSIAARFRAEQAQREIGP